MSKLNKYLSDPRVRSTFYQPNRLMLKFKKVQQGGEEEKIVAEDKEWVKLQDGSIAKINNAPTHDENLRFTDNGFKKATNKSGGIELSGVESVVSATQENRNQSDNSYTYRDEEIKIKPQEAVNFIKGFGFNTPKPTKSMSPSKLLDLTIESKNKFLSKFKQPKNFYSIESQASLKANKAVINSIPTDEELYDTIFSLQENKKSTTDEEIKQYGGDTIYEDKRSPVKKWIDEKTIGFRNYDYNMTKSGKDIFKAYDKHFPTTKDKLNSMSAIASYVPNPYISIPASVLNLGIDVLDGSGGEIGADLISVGTKLVSDIGLKKVKRAKMIGKLGQNIFGAEDITNKTILKQEGGYTGYKFIKNPLINEFPFKHDSGSLGYFDHDSPDVLNIDSNITDYTLRNQVLDHENEHRESFYRSDFNTMLNDNLLNQYKRTPPYKQDIYDSYGNNEELSAFIHSGGNEEIINNFIPKEKQRLYKTKMYR